MMLKTSRIVVLLMVVLGTESCGSDTAPGPDSLGSNDLLDPFGDGSLPDNWQTPDGTKDVRHDSGSDSAYDVRGNDQWPDLRPDVLSDVVLTDQTQTGDTHGDSGDVNPQDQNTGPDTDDTSPDLDASMTETDASTGPEPLFDLEAISDPSTAECVFENQHTVLKSGVLLDVWHVRYRSWEYRDGGLEPIWIQGYAARPQMKPSPLPGIVQAHGLGGFAEEDHATGLAALTGAFTLAYTGPGGGSAADNTSEGIPSGFNNGYRMFDVLEDARGSWFWAHTVAAMRGITCLQEHPDVDSSRLGMTGFSAGAVATLMASGVDSRIKASVPLSGTLAWYIAVESPEAWQNNLLALAGLSAESPEWEKLMETLITPATAFSNSSMNVLMVNGTTDEFFPMTAHMETYKSLPAQSRRLSFAANFDHGCYSLTGVESAATIEQRAALRAEGGQRMWFHHHFGTNTDYAYIPAAPTLTVTEVLGAKAVVAAVDQGGSNLKVESVHLWWSNDDCFVFGSQELEEQGGGLWWVAALFPIQSNTVMFIDVMYSTKNLILPEKFSLSSEPVIPSQLVPHIRDMENCL